MSEYDGWHPTGWVQKQPARGGAMSTDKKWAALWKKGARLFLHQRRTWVRHYWYIREQLDQTHAWSARWKRAAKRDRRNRKLFIAQIQELRDRVAELEKANAGLAWMSADIGRDAVILRMRARRWKASAKRMRDIKEDYYRSLRYYSGEMFAQQERAEQALRERDALRLSITSGLNAKSRGYANCAYCGGDGATCNAECRP